MTGFREEVLAEGVRLILGDCREVLPTVRDIVAVTDPPYGIGFRYENSRDPGGEEYQALIGCLRGIPLALLQYPEEMMRLVVPVFGPPDEVLTWIYNSNLPRQSRLWGFWGCDVDPRRSKQPAKNPEVKKVTNLDVAGYDWRNIPQVKNTSADKTSHPCQLPLQVAAWVLQCLNADTICDPFMGSGTIGVAAIQAGLGFVGIEDEPKYFDIARRRIADALSRPSLFLGVSARPSEMMTAPTLAATSASREPKATA